MNYFLLLMIIYIFFALLSFLIFDSKLLSPSFIFSTSFAVMITLAYAFKDILGFEVNKATFHIFVIGGVLFLLTEFNIFLCYSARKLYINQTALETIKIPPLIINKPVQYLLALFLLVSILCAMLTLFMNTAEGSFGSRMSEYKNALLYNVGSLQYRFYISQLYKINSSIVYLCAYILVYNWSVCKIQLKKLKCYIAIIVFFIIFSIIAQGARQPAIEIILYFPIVYIAFLMRRRGLKKIGKLIRKLIPTATIAIIIFYYTSTLVGRRKTQRGILEYFTVYFCGGLYSFNLHVNEPLRNHYFGQSSFADIYNIFIKLGLVSNDANMQYHTFDLYGNTVTLFGRWYEDFGSGGVYIMTVLVALFFSVFFYKLINSERKNKMYGHHLLRLFYCKFLISLVWAGYDDRIRALLSLQTIIQVILISFMYWFWVSRKIKLE